jgi:FKBP-type peptidyl-prolyl cis-trans isomerase
VTTYIIITFKGAHLCALLNFEWSVQMKKLIPVCCLFIIFFLSCGKDANNKTNPTSTDVSPSDLGYALGVSIGENLSRFGFTIDYNSFVAGLKDVIEKKSPKYPADQANQKIQAAITSINDKKSKVNLEKEKTFLEQNKTKKGVITTASGLQYEVLKEGSGKKPNEDSVMKLNYIGTLIDGTEFDNSIKRGQPASFTAGGVIKGFSEGLLLMSPGSKYKFYIPSALGYGPQAQGKIPPSSTLIFEVELLSFEDKPAQQSKIQLKK